MGDTAEKQDILQPEELKPATEILQKTQAQLDRILLGRSELHRMVLVGILSQGHILLEGLPGLGKTALVKALGQIMNLEFKRLQFTPDLMPSDILGTHILQPTEDGRREMTFQEGPVFTNLLLADEINRASPKTQSAMLEAMQERNVTLMGTTRALPKPFFVLASQNPIELEGTYPLPEAQLDRFLFKLAVRHVDVDVLEEIITTRRHGTPPTPDWTLEADKLQELFALVKKIFLPKPVARYISRLVAATHPGNPEANEQVNDYVTYGASPRAAIAMAEASRAHALIQGRPTAGFEDVKAVAPHVLNHRILLNYKARFEQLDTYTLLDKLIAELEESGISMPKDFSMRKEEA
ncbi:MAG: AAA family ATPase [Deltaproteobacteria bacterium]|nr:AAA family ATPase [Deltaproteobacteria bacterium]MBU51052.1 AAA family ATPase [Deltaproteobacteria bacterium]|tara:strand:- start:4513 stop:5568 length:1056 start_codon:yes stop_codon:yes gene_type:complete